MYGMVLDPNVMLYHGLHAGGDLPGECNTFDADLEEIDNCLKHGADPNIRVARDNGCTALHYAARYGNIKVSY